MNRSRWIAVASGVLAGLGLHPAAQAGGGSSGSTSGETTESSGSDTGSTTEVGPCLVPLDDGSASGDATSSSTGNDDLADGDTGPCLSISPPEEGCDCSSDRDGPPPLALLLPALALRRRGGRRDRIDQLAQAGRLPPDVIARLRARLDDG